jgi:hypothetical protein
MILRKPFPLPQTKTPAKRHMLYGHATVPPVSFKALKPYEHAVRCTLKALRLKRDRDTLDLLREFDSYLRALPSPPRQNSVRGLPVRERVQAIFATIQKQQAGNKSRPSNDGAALRILARVIAAELHPKPISGEWYKQVQVARYVMNLLRAEVSVLYGRKRRYKISRQGKWITRHIYETVRKHSHWWLTESRRQELLNTRWISALS